MMLVLLAALAPQVTESAPPIDATPLATPAGEHARWPRLAASPDGSLLLSWTVVGAGGPAVRCARVRGGACGPARELAPARGGVWANWADTPAFCALGSEGERWLAGWPHTSGAGSYDYDARVALLELPEDGAEERSVGADARTLHAEAGGGEHGFLSLAALDGGRGLAVWLDGRALAVGHDARGHGAGEAATALRAAVVGADGAPGAEEVLDERVCDCCQTALVALPGGELLIAYRDRGADERRDLAYVRGRPGAWTRPSEVHYDGWVVPGCPVNGPALAARGEEVALAWFTLGADGRPRVLVAWLRADGKGFHPPRRVDDGAPEGRVDLVATAEGDVLVSWLERVDDERAEWRVRRVAREAGPARSSSALAEVPLERGSGFLRMARAADGVYACWTEDGLRLARLAE